VTTERVESLARNLPSGLTQLATVLTATVLFGSTFPAGKLLLQHHTPPLMLAGIRFLVAALSIFIAMAFLTKDGQRLLLPRVRLHEATIIAAIGILQTGICIGCLFMAMERIAPPAAALLLFTNPIWVAALGTIVLRQPLTTVRILGLVLGILGVALILRPSSSGFDALGYVLGLLSSFGWAGATLVTKRAKLPMSPWALTFWQMIVGGAFLLCLSVVVREKWSEAFPYRADILTLAWLAIPASAGAYGLWSMALGRSRDAGEVSSFLFLVPFFATILSYCLLGSTLSAEQLLGGGAICLGIWISTRPSSSASHTLLATR
jgi:drug/metabolite transporter (DMT)-like permease